MEAKKLSPSQWTTERIDGINHYTITAGRQGPVRPARLELCDCGVEKTSLEKDLFTFASQFRLDRIGVLSTFSAVLSNIVSNVPAVLVFRPIVPKLADPQLGWLTLAMSSTLAGNLTLLGSVANLIVVQRARRDIHISFWDYCRVGVPLTVLSLAAGTAWLAWSR